MFVSEKLSGIKHGFLSRRGGVSQGLFASLNFGLRQGEEINNVIKNRSIALERLGLPQIPLLTLHQVHGAKVEIVAEPWAFNGAGTARQADALVTDKSGIALGIITADCAPILLVDPQAHVIGALHAGWQGAKAGVIANTVEAMRSLGADQGRIIAAIGPCIGQESYEIGPEFYQAFMEQHPANKQYFIPSARESHFLFDLQGFAKACLMQAGVRTIDCLNLDTYANPDLFFSCRRAAHKGEAAFGNSIAIIAT